MARPPAVVAIGVLLFLARPARADPIVITDGAVTMHAFAAPFFVFTLPEPPYTLSGNIIAPPPEGWTAHSPSNSILRCAPCFAGDVVSLGGFFDNRPGENGATPEVVAQLGGTPIASPNRVVLMLDFTAPDVPVPTAEGPFNPLLASPFQFNGLFRVYADGSFQQIVYEFSLTGRGFVRTDLRTSGVPSSSGPFFWDETTWAFAAPAAVPEPGTLALLAIGLVSTCLAGLRRRKMSSPSPRTSQSRRPAQLPGSGETVSAL